MKKLFMTFAIIFAFTTTIPATTWGPEKHKCPICGKVNTYYEIMSYGGYIYQWPSKFQYVFWPLTDIQSIYCCPDCYFATYMWDFDSIPETKKDTLQLYLQTVKLNGKYRSYIDIPMTTRLSIAEKVYQILGRDEEFWCKFYRVAGYNFEIEKQLDKAYDYRLKSISYAKIMINDTLRKDQRKENCIIVAAMSYFTNQKDSTKKFLDYATSLRYANKKMKEENASRLDEYLTDLIVQYKEFIKKED
jgi:uncharacterized protein (DUF2225 family)